MKLRYLLAPLGAIIVSLAFSNSGNAAQTAVLPNAFYKPVAGCGDPQLIQFFMDAMNKDNRTPQGIIDIQDVGTYSLDPRYVTMRCIGTIYFGDSTRLRSVYGIRLNSIGGHTLYYDPITR